MFDTYRKQPKEEWDPGPYAEQIATALTQYVPRSTEAPTRLLEVGCRRGRTAIWLARQGYDVTGIELSSALLRLAEADARRLGAACTFLKGRFPEGFDSKRLPDASFDVIFDISVLRLVTGVSDQRRFFTRVAQILATNGIYFTLLPRISRRRSMGPAAWTISQVKRALRIPSGATRHELKLVWFKPVVVAPLPGGETEAWLCVVRKSPQRPRRPLVQAAVAVTRLARRLARHPV